MTGRRITTILCLLGLLIGSTTGLASAAGPGDDGTNGQAVWADLDGRPLDPGRVADFYCHDFDYPAIHCFRDSDQLELSVAPAVAAAQAAGVDYVVVFDYTWFQGPYMYISQDYTVLLLIGWNDRISSYMARNWQSGKFWTDWFFSGTSYQFCCNQQAASLGSFNNTFSSVHRL
jgi:hypothetical protein